MTAAWVQRRKQQFSAKIANATFDEYITADVCKSYARMYRVGNDTWEDVYRQMVVVWSQLQIPEGLSLTWIVEQAANSNVTSLTTIADVVAKLGYFELTLLFDRGMPETNVIEALTLVRDLLRNPFSSIITPTISIRRYADLAYLCTYIKRDLMKDTIFGGYRGQAGSMCVMSEAQLRGLGDIIYRFARDRQESGTDAADLYIARIHQVGISVKVINGEVFEIPDAAAAVQEEDGERGRRRGRLGRENWPRGALDLPEGTIRKTPLQILNTLKETMNERSRAFTMIMQTMYSAQIQVPLAPVPNNAQNLPDPIKTFTPELIAAFRVWNINVPDDWANPRPNFVSIDQADIGDVRFIEGPPRRNVNVILAPERPPMPPQ